MHATIGHACSELAECRASCLFSYKLNDLYCCNITALDFFEGNDNDSDIENPQHSPPHGDWTTDLEVASGHGEGVIGYSLSQFPFVFPINIASCRANSTPA